MRKLVANATITIGVSIFIDGDATPPTNAEMMGALIDQMAPDPDALVRDGASGIEMTAILTGVQIRK